MPKLEASDPNSKTEDPIPSRADAENTTEKPQSGHDWLDGPHGLALRLEEARAVAEAHPVRVVVLVGQRHVGKTTLIVEMYQAFLQKPFAGRVFAGSTTLPALEQRSIRGRVGYDVSSADTPRTRLSAGTRLLHLATCDSAEVTRREHLMIADTSGEVFRGICKRREDAVAFAPILQRADKVAFLIDGAKLSDPSVRQRARANAGTLLRVLLETAGLEKKASLDLVVTKWDHVVRSDSSISYVSEVLDNLCATLGSHVGDVTTHRVASRTIQETTIERHFGLADLFAGWCQPVQPKLPAQAITRISACCRATRSFLHYGCEITRE